MLHFDGGRENNLVGMLHKQSTLYARTITLSCLLGKFLTFPSQVEHNASYVINRVLLNYTAKLYNIF